MNPTLMSLAQAGAILGVHPRTVRRYVAQGRLRGYRVGPQLLRVDEAEVRAVARLLPTAGAA